MADSLRTDGARAADHASPGDRDAKIEQLLLAGLDHYFASRYQQAIDVWTRTLFFDRSHARARAYIDRARSAQAEKQRQSEELIQKGAAALDRGQGDEARRLLRAAVESGAHAHDVHPLMDRLSRQTPTPPVDEPKALPRRTTLSADADQGPGARGASRTRQLATGPVVWFSGSLLVIMAAASVAWVVRGDLDGTAAPPGAEVPAASRGPATHESALPLPRRGELALDQAHALELRGRLHEALAALDAVHPTDPENAEADRVRAEIQRQLLAMAGRQP